MENHSVEEIIRMRAENRLTHKQGIDFLQEYREHPEKFLPLTDHQFRHFDEWADQESRNLCWDAGVYEDNCPYFAECWKIHTTTVMTVFISAKGIKWKPNLVNTFVEFIRNGLIAGVSSTENLHIDTVKFKDSKGHPFYSFNMVLGNEDQGRFIQWGRGGSRFDELNEYNRLYGCGRSS